MTNKGKIHALVDSVKKILYIRLVMKGKIKFTPKILFVILLWGLIPLNEIDFGCFINDAKDNIVLSNTEIPQSSQNMDNCGSDKSSNHGTLHFISHICHVGLCPTEYDFSPLFVERGDPFSLKITLPMAQMMPIDHPPIM